MRLGDQRGGGNSIPANAPAKKPTPKEDLQIPYRGLYSTKRVFWGKRISPVAQKKKKDKPSGNGGGRV